MATNEYLKGNLTIDGTITQNGTALTSGIKGIHSLIPLASGDGTNNAINATATSNIALSTGRLVVTPYIPSQTFTTADFRINCATLGAGSLTRILVYSDNNGLPNAKLYESANLDMSTTGLKTATTSFTFTAGTTYWIGVHCNNVACNIAGLSVSAVMQIKMNTSTPGTIYTNYYVTTPLGSAPNPFGTPTVGSSNVPDVIMTKA